MCKFINMHISSVFDCFEETRDWVNWSLRRLNVFLLSVGCFLFNFRFFWTWSSSASKEAAWLYQISVQAFIKVLINNCVVLDQPFFAYWTFNSWGSETLIFHRYARSAEETLSTKTYSDSKKDEDGPLLDPSDSTSWISITSSSSFCRLGLKKSGTLTEKYNRRQQQIPFFP